MDSTPLKVVINNEKVGDLLDKSQELLKEAVAQLIEIRGALPRDLDDFEVDKLTESETNLKALSVDIGEVGKEVSEVFKSSLFAVTTASLEDADPDCEHLCKHRGLGGGYVCVKCGGEAIPW